MHISLAILGAIATLAIAAPQDPTGTIHLIDRRLETCPCHPNCGCTGPSTGGNLCQCIPDCNSPSGCIEPLDAPCRPNCGCPSGTYGGCVSGPLPLRICTTVNNTGPDWALGLGVKDC